MIELNKVSYTYPFQNRPAVEQISLTVSPGEAVLVTGASGCGKSTLVRLANGLCPHFFLGELEGEIRRCGICGQNGEQSQTLNEIARTVGTVFQDPELQFFALNVDDEIAFAHEWQGKSGEEIRDIVDDTARRLGITHILGASIHDLSEGQKQKVAIGCVLSLGPAVVVLDEPSANLDPESTLELARFIKELKDRNIAVLVADHRLYWLEDVVERVVVMHDGRIVAQGEFDILADPELREKYGLRRHQVKDIRNTLPLIPCSREKSDSDSIEVRELTFSHKKGPLLYENAGFFLPRGITGIIGNNGTGKTTLARLLTGLTKMKQGKILINGKQVPPKQLLKRSALILQNTDHQLHMNSVFQEIAMASGLFNPKDAEKEELEATLDRFGLKHLADRHPQSLSGGEKQRLVIACGLVANPDIFILDEPTSGLDGRNMKRIANMIRGAADEGIRVVLITHDLELLDQVCDNALRLPFNHTPIN